MTASETVVVFWPRVTFFSFRAVCRIVALVILTQTALDLSNAALCALDAEEFPAIALQTGDAVQAGEAGRSVPVDARHIDDCFCCSSCVDVAAATMVMPVALVTRAADAPRDRRVPLVSRLFFHPPQLLS